MNVADEQWIRERMLEVLRGDPIRAVGDEVETRGLVDMICGDLLQARARRERVDRRIETAVATLRECDLDGVDFMVRSAVQVALAAISTK